MLVWGIKTKIKYGKILNQITNINKLKILKNGKQGN